MQSVITTPDIRSRKQRGHDFRRMWQPSCSCWCGSGQMPPSMWANAIEGCVCQVAAVWYGSRQERRSERPIGTGAAPPILNGSLGGAPQVVACLVPFFNLGFMSNSLVFMLCYVWSKNFATQPTSLYGLMTVQVPHPGSLLCTCSAGAMALPGGIRKASLLPLALLSLVAAVLLGRCVCRTRCRMTTRPVCRLMCLPTSTMVPAVLRCDAELATAGCAWCLQCNLRTRNGLSKLLAGRTFSGACAGTAQGFYLPFVFLGFSMLIGGNWVADIFGILGGHL